MMRKVVGGMLLACWLAVATAGPARAIDDYGRDFGWGMAAIGANLLYGPGKVVYATLGGLTGSLAYLLTVGNTEVVERIWSPALGGTYVLSPEMLRGEQSIYFSGESYD